MEATPSFGSVSDDGSYDISTGPLTPSTSPLFRPVQTGIVIEKHLSQYLADVVPSKQSSRPKANLLNGEAPRIQNVCFIGAGYVGGPTAAVIALHNPSLRVNVLDRDEIRIQRWKSAHLPIHEPGLNEIVRIVRDGAIRKRSASKTDGTSQDHVSEHSPNLIFTTNSRESLSQADMIFLAVNTPTKAFGQGAGRATNMNAVDGAVRDIATYAKDGVVIVEKSTVPCGTARRISSKLRSLRPDMSFEVLSNPEFLSEGCAIQDLLRPDRVLIGCSQTSSGSAAASALASLYGAWVAAPRIVKVNAWSSELSKLVANAMLAQRISSINSISAICEATGADITEISRSIGLDPRIGSKFLKAGLGFGGSCFRKDIASLTYLAESLDLEGVADYWKQVNTMNELQRRRFTSKVIRQLDENLIGKKIALLGFAFKKDTGDTRESLAVDVIAQLLQERPAEISIFDPFCREEDILREIDSSLSQPEKTVFRNVKVHGDAYSACAQADAIVIITDCDQFKAESQIAARAAPATQQPQKSDAGHLVFSGQSFTLKDQPTCTEGCKDCERKSPQQTSAQDRVDWKKIAGVMKEPRWIFDGRCMLDGEVMRELGFQLQSIGRQYL